MVKFLQFNIVIELIFKLDFFSTTIEVILIPHIFEKKQFPSIVKI